MPFLMGCPLLELKDSLSINYLKIYISSIYIKHPVWLISKMFVIFSALEICWDKQREHSGAELSSQAHHPSLSPVV